MSQAADSSEKKKVQHIASFDLSISTQADREFKKLTPHERIKVEEALGDIQADAISIDNKRQVLSRQSQYWSFRYRLLGAFIMYNVMVKHGNPSKSVIICGFHGFAFQQGGGKAKGGHK